MTAGPEAPAYADPTHQLSERPTLWTRVNTAEATPGVVTPLHWDFYRAAESGMRASAYDRGIYDEAEVPFPGVVDDNWTGAFYGRVALSVDALREVYDRVPGTSADEFELNMFGSVRADAHGHPTSRYHERILGRRDALLQQIPAVVVDLHDEYAAWWRHAVSAEVLGDFDGAPARWIEARERLERIMRPHTIASNFAMEGFAALARSCAEVDRLDLLTALAGGYGDTEDDRLATALWETAHGERSRASLIKEYGFHGDAAGDLVSTVWREDATRLVALLDALASMDTSSGPAASASERRAEREQAEQALLAAVPTGDRAEVERSMAETRHFTALRQLGKVTFWRATDAGRAATRTIGTGLVRAGLLDDRDDVYFLLASELIPDLVPDARDRVAYRRARHAEYERVEIPLTWIGNPTPSPRDADVADGPTVLTALGVNPGVVEGRVRVVHDPVSDDPIEPGEILVCHTTDPSWVGWFIVAAALVIDVGGPMSHGAIVARELGVPCVINTRTGTTALRTGDRVRVDGAAGTVTLIERLDAR